MLANILINFGLIKVSPDVAKETLKLLFDNIAEKITRESESDEPELTMLEVKIWIWIYISPMFKDSFKPEMFRDFMDFIREEIIIQTNEWLNEDELFDLIEERVHYHNDGLTSIEEPQPPIGSYSQILYTVFFERPTEDWNDILKIEEINLDMDDVVKKQIYGGNMIKHILPGVRKAARKIIKMTRK